MKTEETLWNVSVTFQDVGEFGATLHAMEWDAQPTRALERVTTRFGIGRDRVRGFNVEASNASRTVES